jgi:hypothetical protein
MSAARLGWCAAVVLVSGLGVLPPQTVAQDTDLLPPPGFGSLRQDDLAVRLDGPNVEIRLMPLDELILRLLAPDSYRSLHALRETKDAEMRRLAERRGVVEPVAFLVTVFGKQEQAEFDPEQLSIISRNRLFRPIGILAMTPLWNQRRVSQRETAAAVYVFEPGIAMLEPFTVEYSGAASDRWTQSLRRVERERARIASRSREDAEIF